MRFFRPVAAPLAVAGALLFAGAAQAHDFSAVYTETNSAAGNAVEVLTRGADGHLTPAGAVPHRRPGHERRPRLAGRRGAERRRPRAARGGRRLQ